MSDIPYDLDEVRVFADTISPLYGKYIKKALDSSTPEEIQAIGLSLTGENRSPGFIIGLGASNSKNSLWGNVVDEVYDFFCTKSPAYKDERVKGAGSFQSLVGVIASSIGATINVGVGILSGLVSIALILVAKVGKNAWCKLHESQKAAKV